MVHTAMGIQMPLLAKGEATVGTLVGPLASVLSLVLHKVGALGVALSTVPADIRALMRVYPPMTRQVGTAPKGLATVCAGIRALPTVYPSMRQEVRALPKSLPAHLTLVGLLSCRKV